MAGREARRPRRSWRKLHLALDADTGEIAASILTGIDADHAGRVPNLLDQIEGETASVTADSAYDGEPVYQAVASRQPGQPPTVVIPSRSSAVPNTTCNAPPSQRDQHIQLIRSKGRMAWQQTTGCGRCSWVDTVISRYKTAIGSKRRARTFYNQQGEAAIAAEILNRMIQTARPISVRVT